MSERHLPVRPNLDQLKHQAKDLLRDMKRERADAKLADAQFALARSYGIANWPRLVKACRLVDAIWRDDPKTVRDLVVKHPPLLHEMARGTKACNWGPPMSYAANHDVTPLAWGQRFHPRELVSEPAMRLIAERGGHA